MKETAMSPLEQVLRLCAQAAPEPWYPRAFVRQTGAAKENLSLIIENLLLDGLVERTTGTEETGPGLLLSPVGAKLLRDPEALERLRKGYSLNEGERGGIVREALRRRDTPIVSRVLLGVNLLVFGLSVYLANSQGILQYYVTSAIGQGADAPTARRFTAVLQGSGSISAESWLRGDWWRLLTAGFVHVGLLHLGMNMYFLYRAGGFLEQMWGRTRFLLIYLIASIVGTGIGLAHTTGIMILKDVHPNEMLSASLAGASSALCGIIAAEAVWVWLNGKFLPRSVADRWRNNLMINFVLIVFISFVPGVSAWGHFGGAVGGALTALVLHYQRFGPSPWRWAVLVLLVPISFLGYGEIQRMRTSQQTVRLPVLGFRLSDDSWKDVEELDYDKRFHSAIQTEMAKDERQQFRTLVESQLDKNADRREEADLTKALAFLTDERQKWSGYVAVIDRAGPYYQPSVQKLRDEDRAAVEAHLKLFELTENCLKAAKQWKSEDEAALRKQRDLVRQGKFVKKADPPDEDPPNDPPKEPPVPRDRDDFKKKYLPDLRRADKAYSQLWDDCNSQVLRPAKERLDKVVADRLTRLTEQQKAFTALAERLDGADAYKDRVAEKARQTAIELLHERVALLALFEQALRDGSQWTETAPKKAIEQKEKVKSLEGDYGTLLEDLGAQ